MTSVTPRPRLDSHRLIEEFMVLANVAAAEELERLRRPCMYRVHLPPSDDKLGHLRTFLQTLGLSLPPGRPCTHATSIACSRRWSARRTRRWSTRRCCAAQSQAEYNPDNSAISAWR